MTSSISHGTSSDLDQRTDAALVSWAASRRKLLSLQASIATAKRDGLVLPDAMREAATLQAETKALLAIAARTMRDRAVETSLCYSGGRSFSQ